MSGYSRQLGVRLCAVLESEREGLLRIQPGLSPMFDMDFNPALPLFQEVETGEYILDMAGLRAERDFERERAEEVLAEERAARAPGPGSHTRTGREVASSPPWNRSSFVQPRRGLLTDIEELTTLTTPDWRNKLYFGDNLDILRENVADDSVDLIYLDPPFNSNATYNVLFRERTGEDSAAQMTAFEDTWSWSIESEIAFQDVITDGPEKLGDLLQAMRGFLGQNDMMAYLTMMAQRMAEVASRSEAYWQHLPPLRPHRQPLPQTHDGRRVSARITFAGEIVWRSVPMPRAIAMPKGYGREPRCNSLLCVRSRNFNMESSFSSP